MPRCLACATSPATWYRYRLEGLLRGQFGSEAAAEAGAPSGAVAVLIDDRLTRVALSDWERHAPLLWRAAPVGAAADSAAAVTQPFSARNRALTPWRPCRLSARRTAAGVLVRWIGRARRGGDAWMAGEIPMPDASQSYRLRLFQGATLQREADVPAQEWLYPAADEMADFGAAQSTLSLQITQFSPTIGEGDPLMRVVQVLL
jgi:hypothetical protein